MSYPDISIRPSRLVTAALVAVIGLAAVGVWLARPMPLGIDHHAVHMAAARPKTELRPIACEKLPNAPGKSLTTVIVHFPPNAFSPAHRHPAFVSAFVLKGAVRSQMEGEVVTVYQTGQNWHEMPMALHVFAENASASEPAELLVNFVNDDDCGPLVIPEQ